MSLTITLERGEVAVAETVRGRVGGLEAWPDAREARIELRHRTRHLKAGRSEGTAVPISGSSPASGHGEASFALVVPPDAYPTFEGKHFESRWVVEVVVDLPRKRDERAEVDLLVRPAERPRPAAAPETAEWGGYRRFRRFLALFTMADFALLAVVWVVVGRVPPAVLFALLAPAAASLAALGLLAVAGSAIDRLEIALPRRAWRFGESLPVEVVLEAEPDAVAALVVELKGEEVWVTSSGQSTTTRRETIHEEVRRLAGADLRAARLGSRRWEWRVELPLPPTGPPSLGKDIRWAVRVAADVPRRPDPSASIELEVAGRSPGRAR